MEEAWPSLHPVPPLYILHEGSYCYLSATSNWLLPLSRSAELLPGGCAEMERATSISYSTSLL